MSSGRYFKTYVQVWWGTSEKVGLTFPLGMKRVTQGLFVVGSRTFSGGRTGVSHLPGKEEKLESRHLSDCVSVGRETVDISVRHVVTHLSPELHVECSCV